MRIEVIEITIYAEYIVSIPVPIFIVVIPFPFDLLPTGELSIGSNRFALSGRIGRSLGSGIIGPIVVGGFARASAIGPVGNTSRGGRPTGSTGRSNGPASNTGRSIGGRFIGNAGHGGRAYSRGTIRLVSERRNRSRAQDDRRGRQDRERHRMDRIL